MKTSEVLQAWSGILKGHKPSLSIEMHERVSTSLSGMLRV